MTLLVTGGTGTLGRHVLPLLDQPHRVLTRNPTAENHVRGDLTSGAGIETALDGVTTVLHLAGSAKGDDVKTANLLAHAGAVKHLVMISVVGADLVPMRSAVDRAMFGYYGAKAESERLLAASGVPYSLLRATQFHDLVLTTVRALTRSPAVPVPSGLRFQPVDAGEVAQRLVALLGADPSGRAPDLGGPEVHPLKDLIRSYLRHTGHHRPLLTVPTPGRAAASIRAGAHLTRPDATRGTRTWAQFLAQTPP